jgi:hypothetical protein
LIPGALFRIGKALYTRESPQKNEGCNAVDSDGHGIHLDEDLEVEVVRL